MLICADEFIKRLDKMELKYEVFEKDGDKVYILIPHRNKAYMCLFKGEGGKYLSVKTTWCKVPEENLAKALLCANEINSKYKWVKLFVDEDLGLIAVSDTILTPSTAAIYASELLVDRLIGILEEQADFIDKAVNGK